MIAYFVFLLCYFCKSDQLIIEKEQEYYLTDQDKINLYGYVAITSNNSNPNLTEYFEAHQQQLISEALSLQLDQNSNQIFLVENFTNNHVINHKVTNYFRFGVYRHFIQPLIYNDKFVIFNFKLGIQNYILFYDISIRNQSEILDPIYEINSNISGIKQYNSTHYATITEQNGYQIVDFIIIDKYRIKCHQMCQNITCHIKIKNKDSELILEVLNITTVNRSKIENQGYNLELTTIEKTIIVNLVVIILVCLLKKPRRLDRFQTVQK